MMMMPQREMRFGKTTVQPLASWIITQKPFGEVGVGGRRRVKEIVCVRERGM